jgi:predicted dehydrogenase
VERNNVFFNCGTNRRWSPNYDQMKDVIDSGELGKLKNLIVYNCWAVFDTGGHAYDTLFRLNSDQPALWVQGRLLDGDPPIEENILRIDPKGEGTIGFANGVVAYSLSTPRNFEFEAICENGSITALNDALAWQVRKRTPPHPQGYSGLEDAPFTAVEPVSTTLRLIEDLVHSLDTGEAPRGGVRIARASLEIGFALIESQRRGGAIVDLATQDRTLRMNRQREPRLPRYQP